MSAPIITGRDPQVCELAYLRLALRYRERSIAALEAGVDHRLYSEAADRMEATARSLAVLSDESQSFDISTIAASCSNPQGGNQ